MAVKSERVTPPAFGKNLPLSYTDRCIGSIRQKKNKQQAADSFGINTKTLWKYLDKEGTTWKDLKAYVKDPGQFLQDKADKERGFTLGSPENKSGQESESSLPPPPPEPPKKEKPQNLKPPPSPGREPPKDEKTKEYAASDLTEDWLIPQIMKGIDDCGADDVRTKKDLLGLASNIIKEKKGFASEGVGAMELGKQDAKTLLYDLMDMGEEEGEEVDFFAGLEIPQD